MSAKVFVELNEVEKNLDDLGLLQRRNSAVSRSFDFSRIRGESYEAYWMSYYHENWYDFQLKDLSLLYFSYSRGGGMTFLFLGCPKQCLTEDEYYNRLYERIDGDYTPSYEEYLATCPRIDNVAYLRYDKAPLQYDEGLHPANHIHIGFNQKNRIGLLYELSVSAFVAFILRQYYPDSWRMVLGNSKTFKYLYGHKASLQQIITEQYNEHDKERDYYLR